MHCYVTQILLTLGMKVIQALLGLTMVRLYLYSIYIYSNFQMENVQITQLSEILNSKYRHI